MRIDERRVPEQFVQGAQVVVSFHPVSGEHMLAKRGRCRVLQVEAWLLHEQGSTAPGQTDKLTVYYCKIIFRNKLSDDLNKWM